MRAKLHEGELNEVIDGHAKEEAKHKLFFETEYDERVLTDNWQNSEKWKMKNFKTLDN